MYSRISPKDRYQSKNWLGFNLTDLESPMHKFTISNALGCLKNEGPPLPCDIMKSAYLAHEPNWNDRHLLGLMQLPGL